MAVEAQPHPADLGCPVCGRDACEDHLPLGEPESNDRAKRRPIFVSAHDAIEAPSPIAIVEGVAWAGCLSVLVSESGAGKTFALLDVSAAVSSGMQWLGRDVRQGSVAYLSYEGDALGLRLRALRDVSGHRLEHFYILRAHDPLSPRVTREGEEVRSVGERDVVGALEQLAKNLAATGRPPIRLVVIDTVRASLAGSEDSSEHVSAYLRAVRRILACVPDASVILAHHAGWQDGETQRKRERGSSAWRGNCDATLYLETGDTDATRGETRLTLLALKVRDAERPASLSLIRRRVELPGQIDRHGQPVTSCVVEPDRRSRDDREAERVAAIDAANSKLDLAVLRAIRQHAPTNISGLRQYLGKNIAAVSEAVARILRAGLATPGSRKQPYALTAAGVAQLDGHTT